MIKNCCTIAALLSAKSSQVARLLDLTAAIVHALLLLTDIVGFTDLSSKLPTAEVFLLLSNMFNAFDKLTDRFSVYKVETIGECLVDSYR
jgi:class 3 adenylate cyclase